MKRFLLYMGIAIAAISCTKDSEVDLTSGDVLTISSGIATRADKTSWEGNESIGVYMTTANSTSLGDVGANYLYTNTSESKNIFTSNNPIYYPDYNNLSIVAYYPYKSDLVDSGNKYTINLSEQVDLLVAQKGNLLPSSDNVEVSFEHQFSRVSISIEGDGISLSDLNGVGVVVKDLTASVDFNLKDCTIGDSSGSSDLTLVTTNTMNGTDITSIVANGIVFPIDFSGTITFKLSDDRVFTAQFPQTDFTKGTQYNYTAKVGYDDVTITKSGITQWVSSSVDSTADIVDIEYKDSDQTYYINTGKGLAAFSDLVNGSTNDTAITYNVTYTGSPQLDIKGKLTRNIDLSDICNSTSGTSWTPIGDSSSTRFAGNFDGCGYEVSKLYINNSSNQQGLFGYINTGGWVCNLGVTGSVTCLSDSGGETWEIGGVVGWNDGYVINCYSDVDVTGYANVGGIAGYSDGYVVNCYNLGDITGSFNNVGGIVGKSAYNGYIGYCYSAGDVDLTASSGKIGGVVGWIYKAADTGTASPTVKGCFCLKSENTIYSIGQTDYLAAAGGLVGNICDEYYLQSESFITTIHNSCATSYIGSGTPCGFVMVDGNYPKINFGNDKGVSYTDLDISYNCAGYTIYTGKGLQAFAAFVNGTSAPDNLATSGANDKYFTLSSAQSDIGGTLSDDIDLSSVCGSGIDGGTSWTPIGTSGLVPYKGTFDGGGKEVKNLYINASTSDYQGLFGYLGSDAIIKNLGVGGENGSVTGDICVGGIAGSNIGGTIINCYNSRPVNGSSCVGGLAGEITSGGKVINCYNTGDITGNNSSSGSNTYIGGMVGFNSYDSSVINGYNTGYVSGGEYNGGVVGYNSDGGTVQNGFYLSGTANSAFGSSNVTTTAKSDSYMKNSDFVTDLNEKAADYSSDGACAWNDNSTATPAAYPTLNFGTVAE